MSDCSHKRTSVTLSDVQRVYSGPECTLWELVMGEQIHVGGMSSSLELANRAGLMSGMRGVDLCCCLGAGMRLLARFFSVRMSGVDATASVLDEARKRTEAAGMSDVLDYALADVTALPFAGGEFDFVWGEDAWCYVEDKRKLVAEAARVLKPGGKIAFTDWIEGPTGLTRNEALRINTFMKFPYMETFDGYKALLESSGFEVTEAEDLTPGFAKACDFYIQMLSEQHTSDALRILGWNMELFQAMGAEMDFMRTRAHEGKMGRGRFIAVKR